MKTAVVAGAGGFIGSHLVFDLVGRGYQVTGVDLKYPQFIPSVADKFIISDLRDEETVKDHIECDEYYQLAADMGGAGFIFTGVNDAEVMLNSAMINLNTAKHAYKVGKLFFSSSACIYPAENQKDPRNPRTAEESAYPANPDSEYGWEKLFSERLYGAVVRNHRANVRIARFHNVYGPDGTYQGGREKAPAAICRKVAEAKDGDSIEIWGDGEQTRSFMFITDCLKGIRFLMDSEHREPVNLGSQEMVSINQLAKLAIEISGKKLDIVHIPGPQGVRGRTSDNMIFRSLFDWEPDTSLYEGMSILYQWIDKQVHK